MELSEQAAKNIRDDQGIDVIVGNFLDYDNPAGEQFDVVVLCQVLEHLPDSILAMSKISSLLKPNGLALLAEFPQKRPLVERPSKLHLSTSTRPLHHGVS